MECRRGETATAPHLAPLLFSQPWMRPLPGIGIGPMLLENFARILPVPVCSLHVISTQSDLCMSHPLSNNGVLVSWAPLASQRAKSGTRISPPQLVTRRSRATTLLQAHLIRSSDHQFFGWVSTHLGAEIIRRHESFRERFRSGSTQKIPPKMPRLKQRFPVTTLDPERSFQPQFHTSHSSIR